MAIRERVLKIVIAGDAKGVLAATGQTETALGGLGSKFGGLGQAAALGGAAAVTAVVGIGKALYDIGSSFDDAYDKIRVGTGATGEVLEGLKDDFRAVVQEVPANFEDASTAISKLAQITGDEGPVLQTLSEQMLELSRITGTDLTGNLEAGARALMLWDVPVTEQSAKMDVLYRASQLTGVGFADLAAQITDAGPQLQALGFDFDQATTVVAGLGKAGLSVADVMPSMSKAMAVAAKDGKSAQDVWHELFRSIKAAPDDTAAAGVAFDVLGAKAGPKFAQLVRSGQLGFDTLGESIAEGTDTILAAGKETQDFGEKWQILKNRVFVALEPLAMRVFDAVGKGMDRLSEWFKDNEPAIRNAMHTAQGFFSTIADIGAPIIAFFADHADQLKVVLIAVAAVLGGVALLTMASFAAAAVVGTAALIGLGIAIQKTVEFLQWLWEKSESARQILGEVASVTSGALVSAFGVARDVVAATTGKLQELWDKSEAVRSFFADAFRLGIDVLRGAFDALRGAVDAILGAIERVIDAARTAIDWVGKIPGIPGVSSSGSLADLKRQQQDAAHNAVGTLNWRGGLTWVGEGGPELLNLPRGSQIFSNRDSMAMAGAGGNTVVVHVHGSVLSERDLIAAVNRGVSKGIALRAG